MCVILFILYKPCSGISFVYISISTRNDARHGTKLDVDGSVFEHRAYFVSGKFLFIDYKKKSSLLLHLINVNRVRIANFFRLEFFTYSTSKREFDLKKDISKNLIFYDVSRIKIHSTLFVLSL